ncbi:hypothetical protein H4R34_005430, partial [Dimargaris verticillata]
MKFNKTLDAQATELPVNWRQYLIQYKLLKKHIKAIVRELDETLLATETTSPTPKPFLEPLSHRSLLAPFLAFVPPQHDSICGNAALHNSGDGAPTAQSAPPAPLPRPATPHRRWSCPELGCSLLSSTTTKFQRYPDRLCPECAKVRNVDDAYDALPRPRNPAHAFLPAVGSRPQSWSVAPDEQVPRLSPSVKATRFVYQLRGDSNTVTPTLFIPTAAEVETS